MSSVMKFFVSYSHRDEGTLERLKAHLSPLLREGRIETWYDREIRAGGEIDGEISEQLESCEIDGDLNGEEFQCAWSLDSLSEIEVWARNVARPPDSFSLPRVGRSFHPDLVAKLRDGRIFVVEYKGEHLIGAPEAREKNAIGTIWARTTGNVFLMARKIAHGVEMVDQMRNALAK